MRTISFVFVALITASAQTKWKQVSSFQFNWNQHANVQITLEIRIPPFNVYKLGERPADTASLSLPLSKTYNLKHYYGWAGAQCREDVAVVLHPPKGKKPVIMRTQEAEKPTSEK